MTTKVQIQITQEHMPVVVEVLRSDGTISHVSVLGATGATATEYVHSGQTLRVREISTQEQHDAAIAASKPAGGA